MLMLFRQSKIGYVLPKIAKVVGSGGQQKLEPDHDVAFFMTLTNCMRVFSTLSGIDFHSRLWLAGP